MYNAHSLYRLEGTTFPNPGLASNWVPLLDPLLSLPFKFIIQILIIFYL